jgi:hypothetical protein
MDLLICLCVFGLMHYLLHYKVLFTEIEPIVNRTLQLDLNYLIEFTF